MVDSMDGWMGDWMDRRGCAKGMIQFLLSKEEDWIERNK